MDNETSEAHSMHWRDKKCTQFNGQKLEGKRLLGRPKHRREDNIKTDLKQLGEKMWTLRIGTSDRIS
jgi:hypothetical protein